MTEITRSPEQVFEAIRSRRSFPLKNVADQPVERALIEQVLEAANWAPSHGKTEPWRFVVITGKSRQLLSDAFGDAYRAISEAANNYNPTTEESQRARAWQAPVWIGLGMEPSQRFPEWEDLIAFGSAVHNMHLMTSALGLAGKWTSGGPSLHQSVAQAIGFSETVKLYGFFYLGWPSSEWPSSVRQPISAKVRWLGDENAA